LAYSARPDLLAGFKGLGMIKGRGRGKDRRRADRGRRGTGKRGAEEGRRGVRERGRDRRDGR